MPPNNYLSRLLFFNEFEPELDRLAWYSASPGMSRVPFIDRHVQGSLVLLALWKMIDPMGQRTRRGGDRLGGSQVCPSASKFVTAPGPRISTE